MAPVTEAEDKKARMKAGPLEAAVGILAKENLEQTSDMIYSWISLEGRGWGQKQGDHFRASTITQDERDLDQDDISGSGENGWILALIWR